MIIFKINTILNRKILLAFYTDFKLIYDSFIKLKRTDKKKVIIDIIILY